MVLQSFSLSYWFIFLYPFAPTCPEVLLPFLFRYAMHLQAIDDHDPPQLLIFAVLVLVFICTNMSKRSPFLLCLYIMYIQKINGSGPLQLLLVSVVLILVSHRPKVSKSVFYLSYFMSCIFKN